MSTAAPHAAGAPGYWQRRWLDGQTGWHRSDVNADLIAHWPRLALPAGSEVFVPLCGASKDVGWLAALGHRVIGADASAPAVQRLFDELGLQPTRSAHDHSVCWAAAGITIWCGDLFALPTALWRGCTAVYDRAALIALPADLRPRYLERVYGPLAPGAQALLLTIDYPQHELDGPAFSVPVGELAQALPVGWQLTELDARDGLAEATKYRDAGVTRLTEHTLHLVKS